VHAVQAVLDSPYNLDARAALAKRLAAGSAGGR
jgi:hypothetical protein